jgi:hypothetical protein
MWTLQEISFSNLTLIRKFVKRKRIAHIYKQKWNFEDRYCYKIEAGDGKKPRSSNYLGKNFEKLRISDKNGQVW